MSASSSSSSSFPTVVGSSSGRLDLLGGVADYSGSMVLQTPITAKTTVWISYKHSTDLTIESKEFGSFHTPFEPFHTELFSLLTKDNNNNNNNNDNKGDIIVDHNSIGIARHFMDNVMKCPRWCKYILGSMIIFVLQKRWLPPVSIEGGSSIGLHFIVESNVPHSMGVSSSAALEMATLNALTNLAVQGNKLLINNNDNDNNKYIKNDYFHSDVKFIGTELAKMGQAAENLLVGAPCGLMDQLAAAYGQSHYILPIKCQPDILSPLIALPESVIVLGWPSGVHHSIGESPYVIARTAAFMGKKILESKEKKTWKYTADISPSFIESVHSKAVPDSRNNKTDYELNRLSLLPIALLGSEFTEQYGTLDDPLSSVKPSIVYPVRAAFSFPVYENFRCQLAASLLTTVSQEKDSEKRLRLFEQIGELLLQSHAGYSSAGLGCAQTDEMVKKLMEIGSKGGIYGARISGGGSGGTVVVLAEKSAIPLINELKNQFPNSKDLQLIQ